MVRLYKTTYSKVHTQVVYSNSLTYSIPGCHHNPIHPYYSIQTRRSPFFHPCLPNPKSTSTPSRARPSSRKRHGIYKSNGTDTSSPTPEMHIGCLRLRTHLVSPLPLFPSFSSPSHRLLDLPFLLAPTVGQKRKKIQRTTSPAPPSSFPSPRHLRTHPSANIRGWQHIIPSRTRPIRMSWCRIVHGRMRIRRRGFAPSRAL